METLLIVLVIIIVIGALSGGNSIGEVLRGGCGTIIVVICVILFVLYSVSKNS